MQGILLIIFPRDTDVAQLTLIGQIHLVLAGLSFLLMLVLIVEGGFFSTEIFETYGFFVVSIVIAILALITEAIGFFLVWMGFLSYLLYNNRVK